MKKFKGILMLFLALFVQIAFAQEMTVTGTVLDEDDFGLPSASVIVDGTTNGTSTDFDGNFTLTVNKGDVLKISYVGYQTQKLNVTDATKYDVKMQLKSEELEKVVIVAYGSEKASNVTSAVTVVKSEKLEQPNASIDQILQGQAAGLNIQAGSGQPGASTQILLRGRNSINGNVEPLFVIDGVPVNKDNFKSLNSNDIKSISVLKDASASALYGNRAAGGVVIITTKLGRKGEGVKVSFRTRYGQSNMVTPKFDLMNSRQYLEYMRFRGQNALTDEEITEQSKVDTNWADIFLRTGETMSHELSLTNGTERSSSYSSINFFEQKGTSIGSGLKRFTGRNNLRKSSKNGKFNFQSNISLGYSVSDYATREGSGSLDNPFLAAYISLPTLSPYNEDGSYNLTGDGTTGFLNTPYVSMNTATFNTNQTQEMKIVGKIGADLKVLKNLTMGASIGMDYEQNTDINIMDPNSLRGLNNDSDNPTAEKKGQHREAFWRNAKFNVNTFASWKNKYNDKHDVEVTLFTEYFKHHNRYSIFKAYGLDPKLPDSGAGFTDGTVTEGDDQYNYIPEVSLSKFDSGIFSYFGVGKYDYDDRYGVQVSLRRDASSRFNKTNKWGTFWSVSGKWNIHNEEFMKEAKAINNLKLRASHGTTGNDRAASRFGAFSLVGTSKAGNASGDAIGYGGSNGYWTSQIENPDLRWETVTQSNIGVDFGFFENKLSGAVDVYSKKTSDLFLDQPISNLSGFNNISANVGEMVNKGIEFQLSYDILRPQERRGLKWSINGNTAYNQNTITKLVGDGFIERGRTALSEGNPYGAFYAVRWAGVNPANGSPLYLDKDGNITETYSDDDRILMDDKTTDPKFTGGFGTDISYKGFGLNAMFSYAVGQYRNNGGLSVTEDPTLSGISNQHIDLLNEWKQPGDVTNIPSSSYGSTRLLFTDRYIEDASFMRLRNITLSYTFDKNMLKKSNAFTGIRLYMQGQNLMTFTKWRGFDPEGTVAGSFFEYPAAKTWVIGADFNF